MGDHQVAADQQGDDHRNAEDELQRWPEHAHQLHQPERAGNVLAIERFEEADLRLFARKGTNESRAGIVFLGLRGDLGEAGLDALEAVVNFMAEVLDQDAGQRHGRQGHQREPGAEVQQEDTARRR